MGTRSSLGRCRPRPLRRRTQCARSDDPARRRRNRGSPCQCLRWPGTARNPRPLRAAELLPQRPPRMFMPHWPRPRPRSSAHQGDPAIHPPRAATSVKPTIRRGSLRETCTTITTATEAHRNTCSRPARRQSRRPPERRCAELGRRREARTRGLVEQWSRRSARRLRPAQGLHVWDSGDVRGVLPLPVRHQEASGAAV